MGLLNFNFGAYDSDVCRYCGSKDVHFKELCYECHSKGRSGKQSRHQLELRIEFLEKENEKLKKIIAKKFWEETGNKDKPLTEESFNEAYRLIKGE